MHVGYKKNILSSVLANLQKEEKKLTHLKENKGKVLLGLWEKDFCSTLCGEKMISKTSQFISLLVMTERNIHRVRI